MISQMPAYTWTVVAPIRLVDENTKPIVNGLSAAKSMTVEFAPPLHQQTQTEVTITVPVDQDKWPNLVLYLHGFEPRELPLRAMVRERKVTIEPQQHTVTLHEPIELVKLPALSLTPYEATGELKDTTEGPIPQREPKR